MIIPLITCGSPGMSDVIIGMIMEAAQAAITARAGYSSRLLRWTFWSRPTATSEANIADPP